jgi:hypothetical protein
MTSYPKFICGRVGKLTATLPLGPRHAAPVPAVYRGKHTVAAAAFVTNLSFWRESGYFAAAAEFEPLLHLRSERSD